MKPASPRRCWRPTSGSSHYKDEGGRYLGDGHRRTQTSSPITRCAPNPTSPHIVDAVVVQSETVGAVGPVHQELQILPDAEGRKEIGGCAGTVPPQGRVPAPRTPVPRPPLGCLLFRDLLKHHSGLFFCQRPHFPASSAAGILVPGKTETEVTLPRFLATPKRASLALCHVFSVLVPPSSEALRRPESRLGGETIEKGNGSQPFPVPGA